MYKKLVKLALLVLLFQPNYSLAKSFKVVFLNPGFPEENTTGNFWVHVTQFMDAAAADLDIELVTVYAYRNHILMKSLVEKIAKHQPKYVVLVNEKGIALNIIKQLASRDIASFMLLNNLNDKDLALLSVKEKYLLKGSVIPNNYNAGKKLLNGLIALYSSKNKSQKHNANAEQLINVLAMQGDYTTPASLDRERGLLDVIKANKSVQLVDSTVANWSKKQSYEKVKGILQQAKIDIIWTANDSMAFGAKKALLAANIDHPIIIGGINWDVDDMHYPVNLSFGGHVALGAKSLAMLKDIDSNSLTIDKRHQVIDIFESSLSPHYINFTDRLSHKKLDSYDFSRFSLSSSMPLTFTVENLAKAFNPLTVNKN
ncbi:hypothetical protein CXF85_11025 [Colwellia sp. 75C3]|uniref:ABC transporter substrate-binding protein n=1 Tax=Colwellia sp. 75C3 TaxID=888425 RepID=UPI000C321F56|nr:ABC transporter substrate-binding protein [Colwellia sp. 75C3]PKG83528.1 hypothetical protein CXF85_11025 [Colwellia sp. 75C3]